MSERLYHCNFSRWTTPTDEAVASRSSSGWHHSNTHTRVGAIEETPPWCHAMGQRRRVTSMKSRRRSPWDPVLKRGVAPLGIDTRPRKTASPSRSGCPRPGARACPNCTLLLAVGERLDHCEIRGCPGDDGFVAAPTDSEVWQKFVDAASGSRAISHAAQGQR